MRNNLDAIGYSELSYVDVKRKATLFHPKEITSLYIFSKISYVQLNAFEYYYHQNDYVSLFFKDNSNALFFVITVMMIMLLFSLSSVLPFCFLFELKRIPKKKTPIPLKIQGICSTRISIVLTSI